MSTEITYHVNGVVRSYAGPPMSRLLDVLRDDLGLTGAKEGCGEGECGACTILLDERAVCACLIPMFQLNGAKIVTIEGMAASPLGQSLQEAFIHESGVQCGACTPGMILTAHALLEEGATLDRPKIREALAGNLCRCTGYESIYRAVEVSGKLRALTDAHNAHAGVSDKGALE